MKRVVLVLDMSGDEAELVEAAVSATKVRFSGMTLSGLLEAARDGTPARSENPQVSYALTEGSSYLGSKPLALTSLIDGLR